MGTARKSLFLVVACLVVLFLAASVAMAGQPKRVLIITMDQMKPWYVQQYDMTHMLWLQNHGVNFNKAYVGQMASETVVSHNTIVSGLFPKNMGWSDEVLRDVDNVLGYGAGAIVTVGDLSYDQYVALIEHEGYPKLGDYMHKAFPGKIVANFGEKKYQVNSTAASSSDYWAFMGDKLTNSDLTFLPWVGKYRIPQGNLPSYIESDKRFLISSGNPTDAYGTTVDKPAYLYPEDGRYAPGPYPNNLSGDAWVADAAIKVMEDPDSDWSAIHLNFSGIDKIGHMWGGGPVDTVAWDPTNPFTEVHMAFQAKNADNQLGRLIDKLKELGQWKETLLVVLADHGSTYAEEAHYVDAAGGGNLSWYYDPKSLAANTAYGRPGANNETVLAPLNATGNIAYSYQSTAIEAWLIDQGWCKKLETARAMQTLPGVIATYVMWGDKYVPVTRGTMTVSERKWWAAHGQKLVNTMAFDGAADVVGLLKNRTSYGVYGDHGGAQRDVQRIPMVMYAKGMQHVVRGTPFRLVDVMPTVLRTMGIPQMAPMDGKAYNLPIH
jgi:predicted AlkP superfamily pyrophosphatase or phosphodiesterase